jgi:hypothetical protein
MPRMQTKAAARGTKTRQTMVQRSRAIGAEQKAIYHQVAGAGKSRVKREFFELDDADVAAITARLQRGIDDAVARAS